MNHYKHLDHYAKQARKLGYRSRAAFKLIQIDDKYKIIKGVRCAIDLGCAPGGWLQVLRERMPQNKSEECTSRNKIVGIDLSYTPPIPGVEVVRGDATDPVKIAHLSTYRPQLVVSDMAPPTTGFLDVDHRDSIHLCHVALAFARATLTKDGNFVCKVFEGADDRELFDEIRQSFAVAKRVKPDASRSHSREMYFLGLKKLL